MGKNLHARVVVAAIVSALGLAASLRAEIKLAPLFADGMVMQCAAPVPVWGVAEAGARVTVEFAGQSQTATADPKGQWQVKLAALKPSGEPRELRVKSSGGAQVVMKDVLIGEVWLCSGQSNMDRALAPRPPQPEIINWQQEVAAANYPQIRQFYVEGAAPMVPDGRVDATGKWLVCNPQNAGQFSAVGYFFGRALHKSLKVPVGLVIAAVGATPAELWISRKDYEAVPGVDLTTIPPNAGEHYQGKVVPLQPLGIRGVAWYQGESNNATGDKYYPLFAALIKSWRQAWGQELPFLFVQMPPHAYILPELREAQLVTWQKVPRTAMIGTMDCGYPKDPTDWHPPYKVPVGERLALAARAVAYGQKVEYSGPIYRAMKVAGSKILLSFSHAAGGLVAKDGDLKGFEIAAADGKYVAATAQIQRTWIEVSSPAVAAPVSVRYGWTRVPEVNLFNKEGLPASPFRTDPGK